MGCSSPKLSIGRPLARLVKRCAARWRRLRRRLVADESGATTLEWALLLAAIGIPSFFIMLVALNILVEHYRMLGMLNSLPFP
jgi:hypothetical protein